MRNTKRKLLFCLLVLIVSSVLFISSASSAQALTLPFGGRLITFSPPIITGVVNCPAMAHIANLGPERGVLHLLLPPIQPRKNYNFYTPGVQTLGSYNPFPLTFNCPVQPIYSGIFFGTSATPR